MQSSAAQLSFELGCSHYRAGRLKEAQGAYREALAVDPNYADALQLLGVLTHQLRQGHPQAIALVRRAIAINPNIPEYHCNLGLIHSDMRGWGEAVINFENAVRLRPAYATALNYLGNALRELGRLEAAADCYRRATAAKGDFAVAFSNLGNVLRELNRFEDSADACRRAIAIAPNFAGAHNNLANALNKMDRLDEAIEEYHRALALEPNYAEARSNLGNALKDMGRLEEAIATYREALAQNPNLP